MRVIRISNSPKALTHLRLSLLLALLGVLALPLAANATGPQAPLHPFYGSMNLTTNTAAVGPTTGSLIVTTLTITNFSSSLQQLFIFTPVFGSGSTSCSDTITGGSGSRPAMTFYLQPDQTLVVPYPTGLEVTGLKPNCLAAEVTTAISGSVEVDMTGFSQ